MTTKALTDTNNHYVRIDQRETVPRCTNKTSQCCLALLLHGSREGEGNHFEGV